MDVVRSFVLVAFVERDEVLLELLLVDLVLGVDELLRVDVLLELLRVVELLELLRVEVAGVLLVVVVPDLRTLVVVEVVRAGCEVVDVVRAG